jgi:hypothetical protein
MVQIFEVELSTSPKIKIDNREIVEARFVTIEEALSLDLAPHLRACDLPHSETFQRENLKKPRGGAYETPASGYESRLSMVVL